MLNRTMPSLILCHLMDIEDEEEEPWSKEDKCIQDAVMLEMTNGA